MQQPRKKIVILPDRTMKYVRQSEKNLLILSAIAAPKDGE